MTRGTVLVLGRDPSMRFYDLWHVSHRLTLLALLIAVVTLAVALSRRR